MLLVGCCWVAIGLPRVAIGLPRVAIGLRLRSLRLHDVEVKGSRKVLLAQVCEAEVKDRHRVVKDKCRRSLLVAPATPARVREAELMMRLEHTVEKLCKRHLLPGTPILRIRSAPKLDDHLLLLRIVEAEEVDVRSLIRHSAALELHLEELVIAMESSRCSKGILHKGDNGGLICIVIGYHVV